MKKNYVVLAVSFVFALIGCITLYSNWSIRKNIMVMQLDGPELAITSREHPITCIYVDNVLAWMKLGTSCPSKP
jgi:hypothetical protein